MRNIVPVAAALAITGGILFSPNQGNNDSSLRKDLSSPVNVDVRMDIFSQTAKVSDILAKYGDRDVVCVEKRDLLFACGEVPPRVSVKTFCYFVDDIPKLPQNTQNYLVYAKRSSGIVSLQGTVSDLFNREDSVQTIGPLSFDYIGYYDTLGLDYSGLEESVLQPVFVLPNPIK
jgi:hypothetical protein